MTFFSPKCLPLPRPGVRKLRAAPTPQGPANQLVLGLLNLSHRYFHRNHNKGSSAPYLPWCFPMWPVALCGGGGPSPEDFQHILLSAGLLILE